MTADYARIKDNDSLARDMATGAVINLNINERNEINKRRLAAVVSRNEIARQNSEINNIKQELSDIKSLLLDLIQSKN